MSCRGRYARLRDKMRKQSLLLGDEKREGGRFDLILNHQSLHDPGQSSQQLQNIAHPLAATQKHIFTGRKQEKGHKPV